eukprot:TRINITY_DN25361_c0_g1_i1.p1 TRINITY_DN25361_c0_g1~~TRINITY_DN25361_c0_g1_i1.p1  ORF type:complete len:248 (-),score=16.84 TRINITY_DN25361_c0_g1_i1:433-1131(-)
MELVGCRVEVVWETPDGWKPFGGWITSFHEINGKHTVAYDQRGSDNRRCHRHRLNEISHTLDGRRSDSSQNIGKRLDETTEEILKKYGKRVARGDTDYSWEWLACKIGRFALGPKRRNVVQRMYKEISDPKYKKVGKGAKPCGVSKSMVSAALNNMPGKQGAAKAVCAEVERLYRDAGRLDYSVASGKTRGTRWELAVCIILANHSNLYEKTPAPGLSRQERYVYKLRDAHA